VALDAIAEAGFKHVGLMSAPTRSGLVITAETPLDEAARAGEAAGRRGLRIPSVYGGDIPVRESLRAGVAALRRLIDICAAAGAASLLMGGIGERDLYPRYYQAIAACCDYAAERKVLLTLKPHGGLNATGPECRAALATVAHANFQLWYDPGNILYYSDGKLDPVADAATVDRLVTGMCIKDYRHPKRVDVTPGTGQVDFAGVIARLRRGGFTGGPLVIETLSPATGADLIAEARKARRFVESLVR